mmetsp:Transcript_8774/g.22449  ORF Transcript_8774/g.22449 Transcript_8774/m.22449 type:complete len:86 (+) Transcript_8774:342-599(+)
MYCDDPEPPMLTTTVLIGEDRMPDATKLPIVVADTNGAPGRSIGIAPPGVADVFAGEIGCRSGDEAWISSPGTTLGPIACNGAGV